MDFSDMMAVLDTAVDDHLRDDGWIRPADGGPDHAVRLWIVHPTSNERFGDVGLVRSKPTLEIAVAGAPNLKKGDRVLVGRVAPFTSWTVASHPLRPGDGREWQADLDPAAVVEA